MEVSREGWTYFLEREEKGAYDQLVKEIRVTDSELYFRYIAFFLFQRILAFKNDDSLFFVILVNMHF